MTTPLVLTFVGDDRPGLVNAISQRVAACGATWLESRSAQLAGKFAGILLVSVPDAQLSELESSLRNLEPDGLRLTIERGAADQHQSPQRLRARASGVIRPPPTILGVKRTRMAIFPERVFSGVQPTGNLHLGNYLGAIKRFVEMQATHPCIYCVVDLHAITLPHEPAQLARTTREVTAAFLACGIDPNANIVFNQSRVAEHAELAWIFDCVARLGWLNRMTQFKERPGRDREKPRTALFTS